MEARRRDGGSFRKALCCRMIQYRYVIVNLNGVVSRQFSSEVGMQRCPAAWPNDPPGLPVRPTPPSPAVHENAWGHQYFVDNL